MYQCTLSVDTHNVHGHRRPPPPPRGQVEVSKRHAFLTMVVGVVARHLVFSCDPPPRPAKTPYPLAVLPA